MRVLMPEALYHPALLQQENPRHAEGIADNPASTMAGSERLPAAP